jgi:quercetin dioxygenase-like cupin family protein
MQGFVWTMLADAQDTGGRWSMMEQLLPKGSGPPPHKHVWSDESFYILDGTITFLLEGELKVATKGAFVMIARNTRHAFRAESDTSLFLNGKALLQSLPSPPHPDEACREHQLRDD